MIKLIIVNVAHTKCSGAPNTINAGYSSRTNDTVWEKLITTEKWSGYHSHLFVSVIAHLVDPPWNLKHHCLPVGWEKLLESTHFGHILQLNIGKALAYFQRSNNEMYTSKIFLLSQSMWAYIWSSCYKMLERTLDLVYSYRLGIATCPSPTTGRSWRDVKGFWVAVGW